MNRIVEGLRQSPKGQLCYDREIEGQSLADLLRKCSSAPALSSPHSEKSPPHPSPRHSESVSFGLAPDEDDEADLGIGSDQNDNSKMLHDHHYEEKGKRDSFEQERSPAVLHKWTSFADSLQKKSQVENNTGSSSGVKSAVSDNGSTESPSQRATNRTADSYTSLKASGDGDDESQDPAHADLTVSFTEKLRLICDVENDWDNKVKARLAKKHQEFLQHQSEVEKQQEQHKTKAEQHQLQSMQLQQKLVDRTDLLSKQEIRHAVQRVKESHEQCVQRQAARLKEVERLAQQLKEEQAQREHALEQRLNELRTMAHSIANTKATLMSTLDSCPHKQYLSEAAEKTRMLVRKLAEQAEVLVGSADRSGPLEEIMAKLKHFQQQSQNALDFVVSLTAEAEKKAKEEQQRQQTPPAPQAQAVQGQPTPQTGQTPSSQSVAAAAGEEGALAAVAKVYTDNVKLLSQMDAALQPFVGDQQMKKVRFDLQRAVNTPVNAISAVNSAHLRDKLMRLRCLLKGEMVEVIGKRVSAQAVPQGIPFCKNLVAKMIARKADEQVSSSHESAYGVAAVAVGLWCEFPDVGELLMAHLQALCPYVVPFYPPRLPNQSTADYHKTLGYRVDEDGTIEQQDKFLRRMSGLMRLYAAIMVTSPPQGAQLNHPHGLEHAWIWLTRMLNLQPNPDITAAAVYDMLQVTGHFLLKAYRVQFVKLIYCLYKVFLPKLKAVAAGSGPVSRLETFLETTMKNSAFIPEPEGYINPRFWNF